MSGDETAATNISKDHIIQDFEWSARHRGPVHGHGVHL